MNFRKVVFWCHLTVGCLAGIVILVMCVTGVLLAYQRQIVHFAERRFFIANAPNSPRVPIEKLLERVHEVEGDVPASVIWRVERGAPVEMVFGRDKSLLVNPYTGAVVGRGALQTRAFFHKAEDFHRWLAVAVAHRAGGRAITGACNLGFLFLVLSGPYLWLPRTWSRAAVRTGSWFNGKLTGKARDFNWHNVIGFWCCIPLAVIVLCAVVMSYAWANNLVYRVTGNVPPTQNANRGEAGAGAGGPRKNAAAILASWNGLETLRVHAEERVPEWQTMSLRLPAPADANAVFTIDSGSGGRPDKRAQLTLDRKSGAEARWEPFSSYNSGRRARAWMRFAHTGEAGGVAGQTIAAIATLGGAFLVWTGLSLAIRRLWARITR
jgi:uncharacterized iron-regulated membrane protein